MGSKVEVKLAISSPVHGAGEQRGARLGTRVIHRRAWKVDSANFVPIAFQGIRQMLNQA